MAHEVNTEVDQDAPGRSMPVADLETAGGTGPALQPQERERSAPPEVSVVMPCLNEAGIVGTCVRKALEVLRDNGLSGEVIVVDNGSEDGSAEIARQAGAWVVLEPVRGYGSAYSRGFESARGKFIVMADSDGSYDLADIPRFLQPLRNGFDMVVGNRFKGQMMPGAMPWSHRYIGNPILSALLNLFFRTGIGDAHCGMRAFTRAAALRMQLQTGGMEFASEMVINASKAGLKLTEVPIAYHVRVGDSKLQSLRDGWRHLRFMLLYSPTHLYLWPGLLMMGLGFAALFSLTLGPIAIGTLRFGIHWMFLGSLLAILGFQLINLGFFARVYSLSSHIDHSRDMVVRFFTRAFRMEHGILAGVALLALGIVNFVFVLSFRLRGTVDILQSLRLAIVALTFTVIGAQTVFASFFVSMMIIKRTGWGDWQSRRAAEQAADAGQPSASGDPSP